MTPDEADLMLCHAVAAHAEVHGLCEPDELLADFAVVAHWQPAVGDDLSRYTTQFHHNPTPTHVAIGLFRAAERLVWEEDR